MKILWWNMLGVALVGTWVIWAGIYLKLDNLAIGGLAGLGSAFILWLVVRSGGIKCLKTNSLFILGTLLLVCGLAIGSVGTRLLFGKVHYQACARILAGHMDSSTSTTLEHGSLDFNALCLYSSSISDFIRSETVLSNVVEKMALNAKWGQKYRFGGKVTTEVAESTIKREVEVQPVRDTMLFRILVTSEDSSEAAYLANAIADTFLTNNDVLKSQSIAKVRMSWAGETNEVGQKIIKTWVPAAMHDKIIDRAEPPSTPIGPNRKLGALILAGGLINVAIGFSIMRRPVV